MPGRPPKRKRNTTGLRNQGEHTVPTPEPQEDTEGKLPAPQFKQTEYFTQSDR
ncbi:hypothetical protein K435DRAFT_784675 [Dendrothele bispora CBS 962.96]|uniref:Uncharacterized protein n=1 Tax=Dendrothele bispora (strain CBS 962.96) TaxID=1314807 RepID=A0A4S8L1H4_DENBC|nr:hypothetical protein K435DRAFT_784675 [Dendrothele bispora CBS 962.96]